MPGPTPITRTLSETRRLADVLARINALKESRQILDLNLPGRVGGGRHEQSRNPPRGVREMNGMVRRPLVILHGWRDHSASFEPLAALLRSKLHSETTIISLSDYVSMETKAASTISRRRCRWPGRTTTCRPPRQRGRRCPQHGGAGPARLATAPLRSRPRPDQALGHAGPANFGSPLAHKGRSLIARVSFGFVAKREGQPFETGTRILKGLELASPYTWGLAEHDRFGSGGEMYQPGNVLCAVLVGNTGYSGIRGSPNEDGSDGTVRISTANMNCVRMTATFPANA